MMNYIEEDYEIKVSKDLGLDFHSLENFYVQNMKNKIGCQFKIDFYNDYVIFKFKKVKSEGNIVGFLGMYLDIDSGYILASSYKKREYYPVYNINDYFREYGVDISSKNLRYLMEKFKLGDINIYRMVDILNLIKIDKSDMSVIGRVLNDNKEIDRGRLDVVKLFSIVDEIKEILDILEGQEEVHEVEWENEELKYFIYSLLDMKYIIDRSRLLGNNKELWVDSFIEDVALSESGIYKNIQVEGVNGDILNIIDVLEETDSDVVFEYLIRRNLSRNRCKKVMYRLGLLNFIKGARLARILSKVVSDKVIKKEVNKRYVTEYNEENSEVFDYVNIDKDRVLFDRGFKLLERLEEGYDFR